MEKDIRLEELEGLKQQLTLLNKKLEKQSIVNEKLIRNSMREKMLNINRTGIVMCAAMLIATPICALEFHYVLHISLALNIFTCGFMAIAFAYTVWSHWGLNSNLLNGDLITASSIILRTRKRYKQWYYFSWPWFAVWFCWLCYEISIKIEPEIQALVDKYRDPSGERVFRFYKMYSNLDTLSTAINKGLKKIGKLIGVDDLEFYAARHSWATIALNDAEVDKYTVHAALNHVDDSMRVTDMYIRKSWDPIDKANRKVLDLMLFSLGKVEEPVHLPKQK